MAEVLNTNVFDANKKFVDFAGLDYFWDKAKKYVDDVDAAMALRVKANEDAIKSINDELDSLSGGAGSIQTQISNAITALDLPNTYDAKGAAATAEQNAKDYADGKFQVAGSYETAGAAAQALVDAKAYTDEVVGVLPVVDDKTLTVAEAIEAAKDYADGLDGLMDERVKVLEAIDHEQLVKDAAASAVATVLDDAPEAFDTLKEVAEWIADNSHAEDVATLVTDVANLKAINHDAYKGADEVVLTDAKSYADGLAVNYDAKGAAATALTDAKSYVDGKVDGKFDAVGSAATAEQNAKDYADGKFQVAGNYEVAGAAATALTDAKTYADSLAVNYDAAGSANTAKEAAIAQAKLDAAEALRAYYTKNEVDAKLAENSTADKAYAKQYTDELFGSFKFAGTADIDALFTTKAE